MTEIYLVTGNLNKLTEWKHLIPDDITLKTVDIDLPEIQSGSSEAIVADKAKRAYEVTGKAVVVEDVSAGLVKFGGLPGPFIKFFVKTLGDGALYTLAGKADEPAIVSCTIAYYDGTDLVIVRGDVNGTVVQPRGVNGFGFDKTFIPEGETVTFAEMTPDHKHTLSHRSLAIKKLILALQSHS